MTNAAKALSAVMRQVARRLRAWALKNVSGGGANALAAFEMSGVLMPGKVSEKLPKMPVLLDRRHRRNSRNRGDRKTRAPAGATNGSHEKGRGMKQPWPSGYIVSSTLCEY